MKEKMLLLHEQLHAGKSHAVLDGRTYEIRNNAQNQPYLQYEDMLLIKQNPEINSIYGILAREYPVTTVVKCGAAWAYIFEGTLHTTFVMK